MMGWALGVDLGGTAVKVSAVEPSRGLIGHERHPTELGSGPDGIVRQIALLVSALYGRFAEKLGPSLFLGTGVGAPGAVDRQREMLSYPPNLPGWERFPLRSALERELALQGVPPSPVFIDNDANTAALGEARFGAGCRYRDFMLVTLGTGVGGGIILDRQLYRGAYGTAGEIGYLTVDYRGESVHAGVRGTVESLIGKQQIVARALGRYREQPRALWNEAVHGEELQCLSPRTLEKAARDGDRVAQRIWNEVGSILGVGLAGVVALMDIRSFVIGGGISGAGDLIIGPAREQLLGSTLPSMHEGLDIVPAELGNQAGVYGAAALCFG
ncbi:ROK family protein [Prosthecochloris sp. ZM_2]|nr:ROK family protein [Prosthecochloris sp. ZM_2]RNA65512.1 ROK family protein [Prosthecochloris sp. ZM_2]